MFMNSFHGPKPIGRKWPKALHLQCNNFSVKTLTKHSQRQASIYNSASDLHAWKEHPQAKIDILVDSAIRKAWTCNYRDSDGNLDDFKQSRDLGDLGSPYSLSIRSEALVLTSTFLALLVGDLCPWVIPFLKVRI